MTIKDLKPKSVWRYFDEITQIPRPSKKEGKMTEYLLNFAVQHNLKAKKDQIGNVIIYKPATKEGIAPVILQSHVDMVCEKNKDVSHDFDNDAIETYVNGDWLMARGTTLGADNGIGVAAQLAVLAANNIAHGNMECLFTVDEEAGLNGAYALEKDVLTANYLINLDTEEEGEFCIGCAGGKSTTATFTYEKEPVPSNYYWFKIQVGGLNGGHSGCEIHKGLGNSNKILNRYLWMLSQTFDFVLSEIDGGNLNNAIAREAYAIAGVPYNKKESVAIALNLFISDVEDELKNTDSGVRMSIETVFPPEYIIDNTTTKNLLNAIYACPHGVLSMSHDIDGLVETSTNLASVKMKDDNKIVIVTSQRSSTESLKIDAANMVNAVFTLSGAEIIHGEGYPGWKPNANSKVLRVAEASYKKLYGKDAVVTAIHAGLECGLLLEKYPHLDMISCGPTIREAHSPAEKVNIPSVEKWWNLLLDILENIPEK